MDTVHGSADPRFEAATKAFGKLFARHRGGGALSIYLHGQPVVDIWAGTSDRIGRQPWTADTGGMPYSATKGIASTVIHRLADRGLVDYDAPVAEYWPEFAARGKGAITVRMVLTHRAGLSRLRPLAHNIDDILDHRLMEDRLAAAEPDRHLGVPAYHSLTYGWLLAGIARSVTGKGMAELFRSEVADPLGVEGIHLGSPPAGSPTRAAQLTGSVDILGNPVLKHLTSRSTHLPGPIGSFVSTIYAPGVEKLLAGDDPPILRSEMPAANGIVTARGLAAMYSALAGNGTGPNGRLLSESTVRQLRRVQSKKLDRTLYLPMNWRLGYHSFVTSGAPRAFGHIGLAGSGGVADPDSGLAFALVHNRLPQARYLWFDQTILIWLTPMIVKAARTADPMAPIRRRKTAS